MIVFDLQSLGAERHKQRFLNFRKINLQNILNIFSPLFIFLCIFFNVLSVFLLETDEKQKKKYACLAVGHSIPYKMMFVSTI